MYRTLVCFVFACLTATGLPAAEPLRVLFVGNSYTYYSEMPSIVEAMAKRAKTPFVVEMIAEPGATLEGHVADGAVVAALDRADWDVVVLQEQSLRPLEDRERMFGAVRALDQAIDAEGARLVLFETWARRDYPDMAVPLEDAYRTIAAEVGGTVAPVGAVWQKVRQRAPELPIFDADGSHPSVVGSYLTACVLYATIAEPKKAQCPVVSVEGVPLEVAAQITRLVSAEMKAPRRGGT